jgi:hypothetical protein
LASASAFETLSCTAAGEAKNSTAAGKTNAVPAGDLKAHLFCRFDDRNVISSHQSGPDRA